MTHLALFLGGAAATVLGLIAWFTLTGRSVFDADREIYRLGFRAGQDNSVDCARRLLSPDPDMSGADLVTLLRLEQLTYRQEQSK